MVKMNVKAFSVSVDVHGAGAKQSRENPLGVGGLHEWAFATCDYEMASFHI
jgi:hypothetical protein